MSDFASLRYFQRRMAATIQTHLAFLDISTICKPLWVNGFKANLFVYLLEWHSEGREFDPPQLHLFSFIGLVGGNSAPWRS